MKIEIYMAPSFLGYRWAIRVANETFFSSSRRELVEKAKGFAHMTTRPVMWAGFDEWELS